jgi:hypothetical protein
MVREAAKKFMLENGKEMIESESFDKLYESKSLVREIMTLLLKAAATASNEDVKMSSFDLVPWYWIVFTFK